MKADANGIRLGHFSCSSGVVFAGATLLYFGVDSVTKMILCSALLHELGHILPSVLLNVPIHHLRLTLTGAELTLDGRSESGGEELLIALGGPLVNILCGTIAGMYAKSDETLLLFAGASFLLGLFNLLPMRPLDGSRILHGMLSLYDLSLADDITETVTAVGLRFLFVPAVLFALLGNPMLLMVTLWMTLGAKR